MGFFLIQHLFLNAYSGRGEAIYNEKVDTLRSLPYLIFVEWGLILLPFLFHTIYGLKIIATGEVNVYHRNRPRNWLYLLQRASAFPALAFIVYHVITLRFMTHENGFYAFMSDEVLSNPALLLFYIVGVISIVFHFANGMATFCITWGLTVNAASQRIVGYACTVMGIALLGTAIYSIYGFLW